MTKDQEKTILKRLEKLEQEVITLQEELELNRTNKPCYTVKEAAKLLCVTTKTIYNMIDRGELEVIKLGCLRIKGDSLREFLRG